jgi:ParB-like chromosome segregation protein Spo0J
MGADLRRDEICTLPLAEIGVKDALWARQQTDYYTVEKYTELYLEDPTLLPPLDVFAQDGHYVLADGFLRYAAAHKAAVTALPCRIFQGTPRDAFLHAVQVNGRQQGLPYHNRDYEGIIRWFLADDELAALSHRAIAQQIGCSHTFVNKIAKVVQAETAVADALAVETVSTRSKRPHAQEEQQLAALLQVPVRAIQRGDLPYVKGRLIREMTQGATLEEAKARVRPLVDRSARVPPPPPPPAAPEPPPPSDAACALATTLAEAFLQPVRALAHAWPAPPTPAEVMTTLTATLCADPTACAQTDWAEVAAALPIAEAQLWAVIRAQVQAIHDWALAFSTAGAPLADPATLVRVLEQLTAQRYQHPPATARAVGAAIASLEAYLAVHAPTSTTHPARHVVELSPPP